MPFNVKLRPLSKLNRAEIAFERHLKMIENDVLINAIIDDTRVFEELRDSYFDFIFCAQDEYDFYKTENDILRDKCEELELKIQQLQNQLQEKC